MHQGRLWVEPAPEGGSIFTLALSPEALIAAPEVQLTTPVASQAQLVLPHQQKATVVAAQQAIRQVTGKSGISMEAFSDPSSKRAYVGLKYPLYVAVAGGTVGIAGMRKKKTIVTPCG